MAKSLFDDEDTPESESLINERITLPKRSHRWVWILILLILVAGAAWYVWHRQKPTVIDTDYASCVTAGGAILESYPQQCSLAGKTFPNPDQTAPTPSHESAAPEPTPEAALQTFTDSANGFSLRYPTTFTVADAEILAPYSTSKITVTSKQLLHTISVQHCNAKGDCEPTTTDMSVTLSIVNSSVDTISKSNKIPQVQSIAFGPNKYKYIELGAEGEGAYYYFISLPNKKTLMITRTYLDETVMPNYQNAKDFIKKADQDKIAEQILSSLTINPK